MAFKDTKHKGFVSSNYATSGITGNGIHCFGAFEYYQVNDPGGTLDPYTGQIKVLDIATRIGFYSSTDTGSNITEVVADPYSLSISAENATLSNVTVWSANSILTQARGDTRYQANGSYLNDVLTNVNMSYGSDALSGMRKSAGQTANFVAGRLTLGTTGAVGVYSSAEVSAIEFMLGDIFATLRIRQFAHTLIVKNTGFEVETGTANWTWSANSILTQGRGDARYQIAANNTWANLTGKPTLATVATSGNYNDLSNKPASYTLPAATNSTLGGVIVGANLSVSANGTLSANIPAGGGGGFANGDILNGGTF